MSKARHQLTRFAAVFAGGTLLSRVLGLVRDVVLLSTVPPAAKEIFFFAFKFPNMLRDMLGEGAVNAAYVPLFTKCLEEEGEASFRRLVRACLSATLLLFLVLTALCILLVPLLPFGLDLLEGFTTTERPPDSMRIEAMNVLRWIMPYLFFVGMAAFAMGPLFVMKRYGPPSWSPVLLNIAIILCCVLFAYDFFPDPLWALITGVWLGGIAQMVVLLVAMKRHTGVLLPSFELSHPGIRQAMILLLPIIIGQATGEVNKLVDAFFAFKLGAVATLYTANRLIQLPLSVFGIAVAVAILPSISSAGARGAFDEIRQTLMHGLRQTAFLVLPAMVALLVVGKPIVDLLFVHPNSEFNAEAGAMASQALFYYGLGLLSFAWVKVSVQGFFAIQDTRSPVIVASLSMALNIGLNMALVGPFGFQGLALATSLSYTANFLGLYYLLWRRFGALASPTFLLGMGKLVVASALMGIVIYLVDTHFPASWFPEGILGECIHVAALIVIAIAVYGGSCLALRVDDIALLKRLIRRRA